MLVAQAKSPKQSRLQEQCELVYKALYDNAVTDGQRRVWSGQLATFIVDTVGLPQGSYARIVRQLQHLGCYIVIQRGSAFNKTVLQLVHAPTAEVWTPAPAKGDLTPGLEPARLRADISGILERLGGIDIVQGFKDFEKRLQSLEREYEERQKNGKD